MEYLDSIRSKAYRAAWTTDGPKYNPFAQRSKQPDEESGLGPRSLSETHLEPAIEEQRRLESRQAEKEFPGPQHAGTAPPASATTEKPPLMGPGQQMPHDESPQPLQGTCKESATTGDRLKFKNPLCKSTEENEGLDRVETEKSTKSERQKAAFKRQIPIKHQIGAVLFGSWVNLLLVAVPVGFVVNYLDINGVAIFVVNFIAIIPLAAMLSYATEEIALRVGETLGGLLNATFGYVFGPLPYLVII